MYILGLSCYYHDSAAVLIKDWVIIAASQEERFTRKKQDETFPVNSIKYALSEAGISLNEIDYFVYYEKPFLKFERLLETFLAEVPMGFRFFLAAVPIWLKEKLFLKKLLVDELVKMQELSSVSAWSWSKIDSKKQSKLLREVLLKKLRFTEHHQSHSASAFYPSWLWESAILTLDWVGEWTTTSLSYWKWNEIKFLKELNFPHSLWLFYSAFTYYLWFKVNSWEYKVMWLAPYGEPKYVDLIKEYLIDIKDDWSFRLNMDYFAFTTDLKMINSKFEKIFDRKIRAPEASLDQKSMDIAASLQVVTEEIVLKLARYAKNVTWSKNLCLAWWVALNCVANWKILIEWLFENIWIQPASWDAWWALWAALVIYNEELLKNEEAKKSVIARNDFDQMKWSYFWPSFSNDEVKKYLDSIWAVYDQIEDEKLFENCANFLSQWKVIGWHQGRMEFGPRALWNRSILWDPRNTEMQKIMNLKIKYRESFRPFAPSILEEKVSDWFDFKWKSPYMLLVADIKKDKQLEMTEEQKNLFWIEKLNISRSTVPAITHVDYSARIQTVSKETNPKYHSLINAFYEKTWCPILINTSFNVRWEPIVCTPEDSFKCFMRTEMDVLVIENFVLYKKNQAKFDDKENWQEKFELD